MFNINKIKFSIKIFLIAALFMVSSCGDAPTLTNSATNSPMNLHSTEPVEPSFPPLPPFRQSLLDAKNVDFDTIDVGVREQRKLTLKNPAGNLTATNIRIVPMPGSNFSVTNSCQTIEPGQECEIDVEFFCVAPAQVKEAWKITYNLGPRQQTQIVYVSGKAKESDALDISGNNFGVQQVSINRPFEIPISIQKTAGNIKASDFAISPNANFSISAGSCLNSSIGLGQNCNIVLRTTAPVINNQTISENLTLTYKLNLVAKTMDFSVNGQLTVNKPTMGNYDFGQITLVSGTTHELQIKVKNPAQSSVDDLTYMFLTNLPPGMSVVPFNLGKDCRTASLKKNEECIFALSITPTKNVTIANQVTLNFKANNLDSVVSFYMRSQFIIAAKSDYVSIEGNDFGAINLGTKPSFEVEIEVKNISQLSKTANNFALERRKPISTAYNLEEDPASTCKSVTKLKKGKSCKYIVKITPASANGVIADMLAVTYQTASGKKKEIAFDVKGSWTKSNVGTGPAKAPFLNDYIVSLADNYYKLPYSRPSWAESTTKFVNGKSIKVNRPNHGLAHGMRKAALAIDVALALKQSFATVEYNFMGDWVAFFTDPSQAQYNPNFIDQLAFGALMLRSGRSAEDNSTYTQDCARSALYLKTEAPKTGLFPNQNDIDTFVFAIEAIGDKSKCLDNTDAWTTVNGCDIDRFFLYNFLNGVHHLDLRRMVGYDPVRLYGYAASFFRLKYEKDNKGGPVPKPNYDPAKDPLVLRFWARSGQYLKLTGDTDLEKNMPPLSYKDIFYTLSSDYTLMRLTIEDWQHNNAF